jgi:hypothetical protein
VSAGLSLSQFQPAVQIFDLRDRYARRGGVRGRHPLPIGPVKFHVIARLVGGQRQDLVQPLEMVMLRNPSGYHLFFGDVRLPGGAIRQFYLADGQYLVRIRSRYYRTEDVEVGLPIEIRSAAPIAVELRPKYTYPFPPANTLPGQAHSRLPVKKGPTLLRGCLYHRDGRGIAAARVRLAEAPLPPADPEAARDIAYETDRSGQWLLVIPDDVFPNQDPQGDQVEQQIKVQFTWPDPEDEDQTIEEVVESVTVAWGEERSLAQTAVRGWVLAGTGAGISGATIRVDGFPGESTTDREGSWFYHFDPNQPGAAVTEVVVVVELDDGRSQTQEVKPIQHRATVVVPAFRFD